MRCPECNKILGEITLSHVKTHGYMSLVEFTEKYPQTTAMNELSRCHGHASLTHRMRRSYCIEMERHKMRRR